MVKWALVLFDHDGFTKVVETHRLVNTSNDSAVSVASRANLTMGSRTFLIEILYLADTKVALDTNEKEWLQTHRALAVQAEQDKRTTTNQEYGGFLSVWPKEASDNQILRKRTRQPVSQEPGNDTTSNKSRKTSQQKEISQRRRQPASLENNSNSQDRPTSRMKEIPHLNMERSTGKRSREYICPQCGVKHLKKSLLLKHQRVSGHRNDYKCTICLKQFRRKDNFKRHTATHKDESKYQCQKCGIVFSRQDSLKRHILNKHVQSGGGKKRLSENTIEGTPKRPRVEKSTSNENYELKLVREENISKFRTRTSNYQVTIKEVQGEDLSEIMRTLNIILQSVIKEITEFMKDTDLVRMSVQCPKLDIPITIPFLKVSYFSAETLLNEIERVLQSHEEFVLDETLEIEVIHVEVPYGGVKYRNKYVDLEKFLQQKKSIIQIKNRDDLCCARAIVTAKARLDQHEKWNSIRSGCDIQKKMAKDLHEMANVPLGKCGIPEIKKFQTLLDGYQIIVISKEDFNKIIYKGTDADRKIVLYYHDTHFDIITSLAAFFDRSYFCCKCDSGYNNREEHKCNNVCILCRHVHDETSKWIQWKHCIKCNRNFRSRECFELHSKSSSKGNSTCNSYYKCNQCKQLINTKLHKKKHHCGEVYCKRCKDFFDPGHQCYILPVVESKGGDKEHKRTFYIFFDFECTQEQLVQCKNGYESDEFGIKCKNCKRSSCGAYEHIPNLCIAHKTCTHCFDSEITANSRCEHCGKNEMLFSGPSTTDNFCKWLFSNKNAGATVISHNFKGYDSLPILSYLYNNGIKPKVIPSGTKNVAVEVPKCNMRMIDSMNFLHVALDKLPEMFGLTELSKGYFPHLYNKTENYTTVLNHLPESKYYNPDSMSREQREKFLKWYKENEHSSFDFKSEIINYCRSDVDILRRCCLKFRSLFIEITSSDGKKGIDPFQNCITIASACQLVYRKKFLKPEKIAVIPAHGYKPEERHSFKAMQWIKYRSSVNKVNIQHARNGKEKKIGKYKVDGYYKKGNKEVVLEYHGCFWHGCPKCYSRETVNPVNETKMADLYQRTLDKKEFFENKGYIYDCVWECEFDKDIANTDYIKEFIDKIPCIAPLQPRDAFYGGRTEAFRLFHEVSDDEEINYYDFTSLYPFINKTGKTVIGHPEIITENFSSISNYEGLIKCTILPPRHLRVPILPIKLNNKLMFTLCKTCADDRRQESCDHGDKHRALTGTWVTDEVNLAIENGYKVLKIHEVWHFGETEKYDPVTKTGGIFTDYVNMFLKIKQEASGWPTWCQTEADKRRFIDKYKEKEGICLEYDKIKKNPGLRSLAKLMLNSFWGKFGQRSNYLQLDYVTEPSIYLDMFTSDQQIVEDVHFVNDEMVAVRWKMKEEFVKTQGKANVVIAAYTTAQARLKLYSYLRRLEDRLLYADTDSIIFSTKKGVSEWKPPIGDFLGDMKDEVPNNKITHFVTGGPKNYAFKLANANESGQKTVCKVRGITLNFKNALSINYDTIKTMITSNKPETITIVDDNKIRRDKRNSRLLTVKQPKDYKIVFDKRVIQKNYKTLPYGY